MIEFKGKSKCGGECYFYQTSKTTGVKVYRLYKSALNAARRQRLAHKHNLAPKVLSKVITRCRMFHKTDTWNKHGYFYVTEVAPKSLGRHTENEIDQIDKKLRKLGFGADASLEINLRRMADNTLVAIDFGSFSVKQSR